MDPKIIELQEQGRISSSSLTQTGGFNEILRIIELVEKDVERTKETSEI